MKLLRKALRAAVVQVLNHLFSFPDHDEALGRLGNCLVAHEAHVVHTEVRHYKEEGGDQMRFDYQF
jgi:hypothetical protein